MEKIQLIKSIVEKNPGDASSWYLLGIEYREKGQIMEAINAFTEALKYSSEDMKLEIVGQLAKVMDKQYAASGTNINNDNSINKAKIASTGTEVQEFTEEEETEEEQRKDNVVPFRLVTGNRIKKEGNKPDITFKDVGGLEDIKKTIRIKIIKPFENPAVFSMFKKKTGGGILLYGPPGCGKTFIAKATAGECGANFITVQITDILDKFIGESEQKIKDIFSGARGNSPSILFFDEIDTLGYNRAKLSSEYLRGVIDQFLAEMDGMDKANEKLLVFGATNMPWDIDPAFKRPGRFDRMVFVPPPDKAAREVIFRLKLKDRPVAKIDYGLLAHRTPLYSGADIENVVEIAAETVIEDILEGGGERTITMQELLAAIEASVPSTIDWLRTIKNYVKYANQNGIYNDVKEYLAVNKEFL